MRDKLIELIESSRYWGAGTSAEIADRLIANNVFVLPEQMKDSWELALPFLMRLFATDEEQIEKVHREFELQEVKKILTDIRDYLNGLLAEWNGADVHFEQISLVKKQLANLTEYAEKLGVEL